MTKNKFLKKFSALALVCCVVGSLFCSLPVSAAETVELKHDFTVLQTGKVTASDLGAVECDQLRFGCDGQQILCAADGYSEAYGIWKLDAKAGETFHSFYVVFTGRTWYQDVKQKNNNYLKVSVSTDGASYSTVKEFHSNDNTDLNQRYTVDASKQADGASTVYVKISLLAFDSPHIIGMTSLQLVGNGTVELEKEPEKVVTNKKPEQLTLISESYNFNALAQGEVSAEDIGAVSEMNMLYGADGVMLLSSRGGYEIASATWSIEAAQGEPINDLLFTFVGHTYFQDAAQKENNYIKILVSVDGKTFDLAHTFRSNDNVDDTQKFIIDVTDFVQGYGKAYVQMQFLVFDSPHIMGIRSVNLTANTKGVAKTADTSSKKMSVSNCISFTSLPVGEVSATDIGAEKAGNLYFGMNTVPLLAAQNAGEDAYGIWKIEANSGETFDDCHLTLIGRTGFVKPDKKDVSMIKISVSADGENFKELATLKPNEDESDEQKFVYDLAPYVGGCTEAYVKIYWTSEDEPYLMGFRSLSLVGNTGDDFDVFTPEIEKISLTEVKQGEDSTSGDKIEVEERNDNTAFIVIGIVGGVFCIVAAGLCIWFFAIKKNRLSDLFKKKSKENK